MISNKGEPLVVVLPKTKYDWYHGRKIDTLFTNSNSSHIVSSTARQQKRCIVARGVRGNTRQLHTLL